MSGRSGSVPTVRVSGRAGRRVQNLPYMLLIFIAGVSWPLQAAVNSQLKERTNQPLAAVIVNGGGAAVLAGIALLVLGVLLGRVHTPSAQSVAGVPWWGFLGGVVSVLVITAQSSAAVPLGAALLVTLFVAGQGLSSAIFDQFGLLGFDKKPVSIARGVGVLLLMVGAVTIALDSERQRAKSAAAAMPAVDDSPGSGTQREQ